MRTPFTTAIWASVILVVMLSIRALADEPAPDWESVYDAGEKAYAAGRYEDAEKLLRAALKIAEDSGNEGWVFTTLNDLGLVCRAEGKFDLAEPLYQRSLAIARKAVGPEHPAFAASLNNLAVLYKAEGKYAEAEVLYKQALAIREKVLGAEDKDVANTLNNLAMLYEVQGKYELAEPLLRGH
jgi:tetratricopeptide (TPR) repeat protein